jgi:2-isopropylmalate synthase
MSDSRIVKIFDTTLRDGEQSPGCSMNLAEKLKVAQALIDLGVDVIEAGFPIASVGDFEAVREIANSFSGSTICGLARCSEADIDRAWEALQRNPDPRIHVFLATSAIHRTFKLKMTPDEIVTRSIAGVRRAASYTPNVEFSPEDAARTEIDFLCRVVEAVIDAGATTVNIPDTVGYATPAHMGSVISSLMNRVPNIDKATISIHCHNDLGLAVANSLAAVEAGAGQIECTINGIGERAGNCSLEEVVMAMRTRNDYYHCDTRINSRTLVPTSQLVSSITGMQVQRNKAIVGRNAFAHEAGIHQDGMLKERTTYEIMRPEDVGFDKTDLVLGKHSGRAALLDRARQLGYNLEPDKVNVIFERFKDLADRKKEVFDGDIAALIENELYGTTNDEWALVDYTLTSDLRKTQSVHLEVRRGDQIAHGEAVSDAGPVEAGVQAIRNAVGLDFECSSYTAQSLSMGEDATVNASFEITYKGEVYRGRGVSRNIFEASLIAVLNAVNRAILNTRCITNGAAEARSTI